MTKKCDYNALRELTMANEESKNMLKKMFQSRIHELSHTQETIETKTLRQQGKIITQTTIQTQPKTEKPDMSQSMLQNAVSKHLYIKPLNDLINRCPGATGAIIASTDGHIVSSYWKKQLPETKLSAMTSSLIALGETISLEMQQNLCKNVIIENEKGRVVCLRVTQELIFSVVAASNCNLGMLLSYSRDCANTVADIVEKQKKIN